MKKTAFLLILILFFWGCAMVSQNYRLGTNAAMSKDWDKAVEYLERASLEDPKNSMYRLALVRAKISASIDHLIKARKFRALDNREDALEEYNKALFFDPTNTALVKEAMEYSEPEKVSKFEKPPVKKIEPPVKLNIKEEMVQLSFRQEASLRSIFQALGKYAGINIIFDEQFRDKPYSIELDNMSFEKAVSLLCMAGKSFYRVIDENTIIVVPDNPQNRTKYEITAIKTFYLSNINAQEILSPLVPLLRTPMKAPIISVDKNMNSITIRDTPKVVELAERVIRLWDKPRGEVTIDLEIMVVSRVKLLDFGVGLDSYTGSLQYTDNSAENDTGWYNLSGLGVSRDNFLVSFPSAFLKFLQSDADTKLIAQPRLRGVEGQEIEYLVGDEIPIPRTTFSPFAAGGQATQPITNFEFKNVGIEIKIKPTIHHEGEVSLELDMKIKSIGGTGYADIPIIATRQIKNIIRLKDGETNLLAGLLKDEERKTKKGFAFLTGIPLIGDLFSNTDQTITQTDVIMTITPHIIRKVPITEEDRNPLWFNLEAETSGGGSSQGSRVRADREDPYDLLQRERADAIDRMREEQAASNRVALVPGNFEGTVSRNFRVSVNMRCNEQIQNMSFVVNYNAQILKLNQVVVGAYTQQFGKDPSFLQNIDNASGSCTIGFTSPDMARGFKGNGRIATLVFEAITPGESTMTISGISAQSVSGGFVSLETQDSQVRIR